MTASSSLVGSVKLAITPLPGSRTVFFSNAGPILFEYSLLFCSSSFVGHSVQSIVEMEQPGIPHLETESWPRACNRHFCRLALCPAVVSHPQSQCALGRLFRPGLQLAQLGCSSISTASDCTRWSGAALRRRSWAL